MITIPIDVQNLAFKEIVAKGLAVMILAAWIIMLTYQNFTLNKKVDSMQIQMYNLQSDIIKENTKALYEFNLKTK